MIENGKDFNNETLQADVCIVGSGPAGITTAWELIRQNPDLKVIILDGSRVRSNYEQNPNYYQDNWPNKVWLYNGTATGLFTNNEPEFLIRPNENYQYGPWERERTYGGTSTHWGGQSRPLDPITFEGVAGYDGWPLNYAELKPYFDRAANLVGIQDNFTAEFWQEKLGGQIPELDGFNAEMYQFIKGANLRFATRPFGDFQNIGATNVRVIRNASLLDFTHSYGSVTSARVGSMTDDGDPPSQFSEFTVESSYFVLAMGAVANARQMLLSGVPNDNVGRYFMCHPLVQGNQGYTVEGNYLDTDEITFMNGRTYIQPDGTPVDVEGRFIPNAEVTRELGIGRCWFWANPKIQPNYYSSNFYFEQSPNPNSRITLAETTDPVFHQRQTAIDWQFNDQDENTYNQLMSLFEQAIQKINPDAKLYHQTWDQLKSSVVVNGHHLGTTRMADDPGQGVVDSNLCSHDLNNLFVAGSSVWPSAGISNPTFTIITLSIRLADHLLGKLKGAGKA